MYQIFLSFLRDIGTFLEYCGQSISTQKVGQVEQIHGEREVNISSSIRAPWNILFGSS